MKIGAVIPSRYLSTRFEGKPLVKINGISMIQRVYRQVEKAGTFSPSEILVATDDQRIASTVQSFGGNAMMTSTRHTSGSERLGEVLEMYDFDAVINIQGDEPIVSEELIAALYAELAGGKHEVVTAAYYSSSHEDYLSPHVVKVVVDRAWKALYFSRSPIPFVEPKDFTGFHHHIGMYGYVRAALERFISWPRSPLETIEKLEQLRFLENNTGIQVVPSKYPALGVDVPEDVARVEKILASGGKKPFRERVS